ncbi:hypothetical protein DFH27DRAFT_255877 [Peziza echinospora]|nr:hypothetical protein DFH27DRAFT_255877 [Peziza echinospora]
MRKAMPSVASYPHHHSTSAHGRKHGAGGGNDIIVSQSLITYRTSGTVPLSESARSWAAPSLSLLQLWCAWLRLGGPESTERRHSTREGCTACKRGRDQAQGATRFASMHLPTYYQEVRSTNQYTSRSQQVIPALGCKTLGARASRMGSVRWAQIKLKAGSGQGPCAQGLPEVKGHHTRLGPPYKPHECTETRLTIIMLLSQIWDSL